MASERLYSEQEIAAIFERAAEAQEAVRRQVPHEGLTLDELQQIGASAGIAPAFIARAAAALDASGAVAPPRKLLGLPVGVARTVDLPVTFSGDDWDRLVVDLRETFHARGTVRSDGALRQWTNGNLQALLEPTDAGYRLRLRTTKGSAQSSVWGGLATVGMALLMAMLMVTSDFEPVIAVIATLIAAIGIGLVGQAVYGLPRWARERERQMEGVAHRVVERTGGVLPGVREAPRLGAELGGRPAERTPVSRVERVRS